MSNIVVLGKGGIRVEVVLHSITEGGDEIITFLRDYPRIVHAEDLKHRMHSNSAASSRAIPAAKMAEQLTGMPVRFGEANPGMQDKGEDYDAYVGGPLKFDPYTGEDYETYYPPKDAWVMAKAAAVGWSNAFAAAGYHKQVYNRLTEPFQMIRVLTTMTETANFYWLRDDVAADPTLAEVARCMREAHALSKPRVLKPGQWHLPFVTSWFMDDNGEQVFFDEENPTVLKNGVDKVYPNLTLDEAIKMSCARSAATSFRNENYNLAKCLQVYDRLVNGDKVHAGALEHAAKVMQPAKIHMSIHGSINLPQWTSTWEPGVSHMDREGRLWSGNFKGWIQHRKMVPGENYEGLDKAPQPA